jgi:hypothetical protein
MRVIRTEMYFDKRPFDTRARVPGVSVAWIEGSTRESVRYDSDGQLRWDDYRYEAIDLDPIPSIGFELKLRDTIRYSLFGAPSGAVQIDDRFVDFVLREPVVIERSPPVLIKLRDLIDGLRKDPRAVGAFIGMLAGYEHPPFLLITVPAGIFLVGSAPAITRAIERGVVKIIDEFFDHRK